MTERQKCLVLLSKNVFTATGEAPFDGFVAIEGNKIAAVGPRAQADEWVKKATQVLELGNRVVTPGLCGCTYIFHRLGAFEPGR